MKDNKDIQSAENAGKKFRKWIAEETDAEVERQRDKEADWKADQRKPLYDKGWKSFGEVLPPQAVAFMKRALELFKKKHPDLFK